jgi:hypothetical protein
MLHFEISKREMRKPSRFGPTVLALGHKEEKMERAGPFGIIIVKAPKSSEPSNQRTCGTYPRFCSFSHQENWEEMHHGSPM